MWPGPVVSPPRVLCVLELVRWEPPGRVQSCKEFDVSRETTRVSVARGCGGRRSIVGRERGGVDCEEPVGNSGGV